MRRFNGKAFFSIVRFFNISSQAILLNPFDLVVMLNTYRGWKYAALRQHEQNVPELANRWFGKNARFTVLTATDAQVDHLPNLGFLTAQLGKGEDNSK